MIKIQIPNDPSGRIIVSCPYDLLLVSKAKTIEGRRWHPVEKHWRFLNAPTLAPVGERRGERPCKYKEPRENTEAIGQSQFGRR